MANDAPNRAGARGDGSHRSHMIRLERVLHADQQAEQQNRDHLAPQSSQGGRPPCAFIGRDPPCAIDRRDHPKMRDAGGEVKADVPGRPADSTTAGRFATDPALPTAVAFILRRAVPE